MTTAPSGPLLLRMTRDGRGIAAAAAAAVAVTGFAWGTNVAGGSDSYCYLSQAELFAQGKIVNVQPIAATAPWESGAEAFAPAGHVRAFAPAGATVPMCPPGYPLVMALARLVGGRAAMFAVVPLFGAVLVWVTFLVGRRVGGPFSGVLASVLMAASPPLLYQVVQPMSDVPAAAFWAVALLTLTADRFPWSRTGALLGGVAIGAALLVRPNLVPVAAVAALAVFIERPVVWRHVARTWILVAAGVLPFAVTVAALQNAMYGGPLTSGYGRLDLLFQLAHVWPNLQRYPVWLLETETPIVLCAFAAPWLAGTSRSARQCVWLMAFAGAVFACYIPYVVFDAWWYLRFLLPAYPALLVATAVALAGMVSRVPQRWRWIVVATLAFVPIVLVRAAVGRHVLELREFEHRFRLAGEYVAAELPANAAVITAQESGSVRFYSGRLTLAWRELPAGRLDRALDYLRSHGFRPYLLLEHGEQRDFVERFGSGTPIGSLGWPPIADINHEVRIYDPEDYARYRSGIPIRTDRLWVHYNRRGQFSILHHDKKE
jgi:hypothetical protein